MRRAQKKQVEDFVKLLNQAHCEIKNYMEKNAVSEGSRTFAKLENGSH